MSRFQMIVLTTCLVMMTVGCRNRCNNPCGGMFAGGPATIAPPATYSLNIPSVARNQPYYTPGAGNNVNTGTLSTYGRAPTPATRQAQQTQQGWKAAGTDLSNSNQNPNSGNGQTQNPNGQSVLTAPTTFVENNALRNTQSTNPNFTNVSTRTASAAPMPGTGQSFTDSRNYSTTSVDERNDSTRLAVTDASQVRAPARNYPAGYTGQPLVNGYTNQVPQTYVAQNGAYGQPVQSRGYTGNPLMVSSTPGYQGQPLMAAPNYRQQFPQYPTSSPPTVLAQATATANPGSTTQLGWRDRDLTNGRTGRF